jgi:SAM-dependent methyltransferase
MCIMIVAVDLDGVICEEMPTFSRPLARVMPGAAQGLRTLHEAGHRVIIYTARGWAEYEVAKAWLKANEIVHDELIMGKPIVDCFIDDRAIRFQSWPAVLENLDVRQKAGDFLNDHNLKIIRETASSFLREIARDPDLQGPVLDVGPMWSGSGVFKTYPELFVDARLLFEAKGVAYETMDIAAETGPDFVGDFTNGVRELPAARFGTVILNHCIEHMPRLFEVPLVLEKILKPGGRAFIATPWNFRFHGPRPDCWRISDDGYNALFEPTKGLEVVSITKNGVASQPLHPASIHCVVRRRSAAA